MENGWRWTLFSFAIFICELANSIFCQTKKYKTVEVALNRLKSMLKTNGKKRNCTQATQTSCMEFLKIGTPHAPSHPTT
jgi:hypothetical protein